MPKYQALVSKMEKTSILQQRKIWGVWKNY